jgi:hypothetical protein
MRHEPPNKLHLTPVGALSSAFAVHAGWSRVSELWTLGSTSLVIANEWKPKKR